MEASARIDRLRRQVESTSASVEELALTVEQLSSKSSASAQTLRLQAIERLSAELRIDNHPLLRKRSASLLRQDIPNGRHLTTLKKAIERAIAELDVAREREVRHEARLGSRASALSATVRGLKVELEDYVDALTKDRETSISTGSASLRASRDHFVQQVIDSIRAKWPKRSALDSASQDLAEVRKRMADASAARSAHSLKLKQLQKRLRLIVRVSEAAKRARKELQEVREVLRKLAERERAAEADRKLRLKEQDRKRKESIDRLQSDLDRENLLIKETAQQLAAGQDVVDVLESLRDQGVLEPLRIAQQATIFARNVLLSHRHDD